MIASVRDARQHNSRYYCTGRVCRYSHQAPRFTANRCCTTCAQLAEMARDAEQKRAYMHKYDKARAEQRREYQRERYHRDAWLQNRARYNNPRARATRRKHRELRQKRIVKADILRDDELAQAQMRGIYEQCRARSAATGVTYSVDHIVPLRSKLVCGLHVPWNLQIITSRENSAKGASWDPNND